MVKTAAISSWFTLAALLATPVGAAPTGSDGPGPFGLKMGTSLAELRKLAPDMKNLPNETIAYNGKQVPLPHDSFESYNLLAAEGVGLCAVNGIGRDIRTNSFGEQVQGQFSSLKKVLVERYGRPSFDFDNLRSGSIWRDANDWMMGLYKKERTLKATWFNAPNIKDARSVELPNNLFSIELEAVASNAGTAYVNLSYTFHNNDECVAARSKTKNRGL